MCVTPTNLSFAYLAIVVGLDKKRFDLCIEGGEFRLNSSSRQQSVVVEEIVLGILLGCEIGEIVLRGGGSELNFDLKITIYP